MKPKSYRIITSLALVLGASAQYAFAQLNVPSDGSDGVLNITTNTVIDLSQAVTTTWSDNNAAHAGKGVYDPVKWAVVFKYTSVNIGAGATVTFANHPSHAPVVWLVKNSVTVDGNVRLDGKIGNTSSPDYLIPTEPGPGGFRGGAFGPAGQGTGYGPGGTYGWGNARYSGVYGNPQILPLVGGSGSSADGPFGRQGAGSSGGGAILIVGQSVSVAGEVTAGGSGFYINSSIYSYSTGGAIRIVADQILGAGTISADRTRTEANEVSAQLNINPNTVRVPPGTTPIIWPPDAAPTAKVISVNTQASPSDPLADVLTSSDINISTNAPVDILIETKNFPPNGAVNLRVVPKYGAFSDIAASYVSGSFNQATWKATSVLPQGFCVLQAHATSP